MTTPTYLTMTDIARSVGVSVYLVRHWIVTGRLAPTTRTLGGVLLFDPADIAGYLDGWRLVRRRPYRRRSVNGLDESAATAPDCGVPPPIPRTARRGFAIVSRRAIGGERQRA